MTDGYWIRADTGSEIRIPEHETAIRRPEIALRLGVPVPIFRQFARYKIGTDRDQFLPWLMKKVPIIRARGYGVYVTLEWGCVSNLDAFRAIHRWGKRVGCGDCLFLQMTNLRTGKQFGLYWLLFDEKMRQGKRIVSMPVKVRTA